MIIKICGLKDKLTIDKAYEFGYNFVGFVVEKNSPRYISMPVAIELSLYAQSLGLKTVVVSKTTDNVIDNVLDFDYVQVYDEGVDIPWERLILGVQEQPSESIKFKYLMVDESLGRGILSEPPKWINSYKRQFILSGGIDVYNVLSLLNRYKPAGVDISSGVEVEKGKKDIELMKQFIGNVKQYSA